MLCENCQKNIASVHFQTIINNIKTTMNLCSDCAGEMMASDISLPISFDNLFQGFIDSFFSFAGNTGDMNYENKGVKCPVCGMTCDELAKHGRLGCFDCYSVFKNELDSIFKNVQSSNEHLGKYPNRSGADMINQRKVDKLRIELSKAVQNEEYELAAELRDKIKYMSEGGSL